MLETEIETFWDDHPCGDQIVGGLDDAFLGDYERFFDRYDAWRYDRERHILTCLDALDLADRRVLEIGLGQGADAEQLIRRGARWTGVDLTAAAVTRVRARIALRGLPYDDLRQASALELPFADGSFDMVFSHGVLHHIPEIHKAQAEIARVLEPQGELVVMLYARRSLNYQVAIRVVRRAALLCIYPLAQRGIVKSRGIVAQHVENARRDGLFRYLRMDNFVHRSTDGALNPYTKVYDLRAVAADFPAFRVTRAYKVYMHAPPLPVHKLPGASKLGWHLWVHLSPR
jgi:SAM-dependent methyltransferase